MGEKVKGNLFIIGGAECKNGEAPVLRKAVEVAGGHNARLVVITTATEQPEIVGRQYIDVFNQLGAGSVEVLDISSRAQANEKDAALRIKNATGIFFTGGDQLRITSIIGGTLLYDALLEAYSNGAIMIGTSAGASMMSSTMIVDGESNSPARKCTLKMAPGLGFLEEVIIDQHFDQRGRLGRLLCGVAQNPNSLGIGIDEDTAIYVKSNACFEIIGSNAITIVDGKSMISTNVSEMNPDEILAISGVTIHVLPGGYFFDMKQRRALEPDKAGRNSG